MSDTLARTAADIMKTNLLTVSVGTRLTELAELLGEHQIGGVPVTNEAGGIIGVVSLRDVVAHYAGGSDARPDSHYFLAPVRTDDELYEVAIPEDSEATVADVMTAEVHSVDRKASLSAVAARMVELHIHRVLVSSGPNEFVGMITAFDVLQAIAEG